jgi:hypothetical protein
MDELQKLLSLFEAIEPLHKKVEGIGRGLDGPALNETRNATFHLLKALRSQDESEKIIQIERAERHAQRAIYDCHEAVLLVELDKLRAFKTDYKDVVIGDVIVNYQEGMQDAEHAKELIQSCRDNQKDRNNFYEEIDPLVKKISNFNKKCEIAREELNKSIRKDNQKNRLVIWGIIVTLLGTIGAFGAWLLPKTAG